MVIRCSWCGNEKIYQDYHDNEWGVPSYDDRLLFEMLILEGAQAGLSFITILKKRENYKKAFDNFDVLKVANYNKNKIDELLLNQGIIKNKLKIKSSVINAKIFIKIQKEFDSFSNYIWGFVNNKQIINNPNYIEDIPIMSDLSIIISKDLKKRGMKFVGPIIIYSYLQAIGIIDDHITNCFKKR